MDVEIDEKSEWTEIREKLKKTYKFDDSWNKAIQLFNKRVKRKFFDPIQKIIDSNKLKGEGFTIVTAQCALIEMFAAFRVGKIFNHMKTSDSPKYEYKESQRMFTSLLYSASIFQNNFWQFNDKKILKDKPFSATEFYKNVRCGLMHEARTKENWYITAIRTGECIKTEKKFLISHGDKIKIHRNVLHYRLLAYLTEYSNELRGDTHESELLRKYLARKLDHLFDFDVDITNDWWTE